MIIKLTSEYTHTELLNACTNICIGLPTQIDISGDSKFILDSISCMAQLAHFPTGTLSLVVHSNIESINDILNAHIPIYQNNVFFSELAYISEITGKPCDSLPLPKVSFVYDEFIETQNDCIESNVNFVQNNYPCLGILNEHIARELHNLYLQKQTSADLWDNLSHVQQEQNIYQMYHHQIKFSCLGYKFVLGKNKEAWDKFRCSLTDKVLLMLAEMEHNRWWAVQLIHGWHVGQQFDEEHFIHPDMIPFTYLDNIAVQKDIDTFENILEIYNKYGWSPIIFR